MKQFNLDEYLKNPNRKVITRDGNSVRILCTDAKGNFPIIALVEMYNGVETVLRLKENGHFYNDTEDSRDLFFVTEKHERWINLYKDDDIVYASMDAFNTKKEAKVASCSTCVTTVKVEWEE